MKKVVTIGGSSSKNSINRQLAEYAGEKLENVALIKIDLNDFEMPMFSIDMESEHGYPKTVLALNDLVASADGFVISLAEHNGAYAAAFKNAFDWLSRVEGKVWRNKPMVLLSTSPGARGGATVLEIAKGRFPYNGGNIVGSMSFPSFFDNFKDGKVVDKTLEGHISALIQELKTSL